MVVKKMIRVKIKLKEDPQVKLIWRCLIYPTVLALTFLFAMRCAAEIPEDKKKHIAVSTLLTTSVYTVLRTQTELKPLEAYALSVGATILLGTTKELTDRRFEWSDMGANGLGIVLTLPLLVIDYE